MKSLAQAVAASLLPAALWMATPAAAQPAAATAANAPAAATARSVAAHYAVLVHANYEDARDAALALQKAIAAFTAAPSEAGLATARKAWLDAR
ncbi:MAG: iron-regulated protein, partial [Variovorax sp.]